MAALPQETGSGQVLFVCLFCFRVGERWSGMGWVREEGGEPRHLDLERVRPDDLLSRGIKGRKPESRKRDNVDQFTVFKSFWS